MLLGVPNVSEGRDPAVLRAIGEAFARGGARVLDVHTDPDHHRSVFTLAAPAGRLAPAMLEGFREAAARIDLTRHQGVHPRVGAVDVAPVVHRTPEDRGAAAAEALVLADMIGEEGVPVYLYGVLGDGRTRAELRRPGALDGVAPDFGPPERHPTAGATLVAARPPLVAFNVEIDASIQAAREIAAHVRRLPSVVALGLELTGQGIVQVSTNIEDHTQTTPAQVVEVVRAYASVTRAELVALTPAAAFAGFPAEVPVSGLRTIEEALSEH